jgi:hypothetical protein
MVGLLSPPVREQLHKPKASFVKSPPCADRVLSFQVLWVKKPKAQFLVLRQLERTKPYMQSYRTAVQSGLFDLRLVKAILDPLPLDPGLDFIVLDDGAIELTETGFRRMVQAHSVELDVVIGVDGRDLLRLPARRTDVVHALSRGDEKLKEIAADASFPEEPIRCAGTSKSCSRQKTKRLP